MTPPVICFSVVCCVPLAITNFTNEKVRTEECKANLVGEEEEKNNNNINKKTYISLLPILLAFVELHNLLVL